MTAANAFTGSTELITVARYAALAVDVVSKG
jgi:hypothetical protein